MSLKLPSSTWNCFWRTIWRYVSVKCWIVVEVLVIQLCLTLCDPTDCSLPRLLCPWNSSGKSTGAGSHSLLWGISLTQGSNLGLPHCRQIVYHPSHYITPQNIPWGGTRILFYCSTMYLDCFFFVSALLLLFSCSVVSDLLDPLDCSTPGFPVLHYVLELAQAHVHWVGDAIQPSRPLSSLLLLPSVFPSIKVFSNELALCIRWPKYWSFSISPSN